MLLLTKEEKKSYDKQEIGHIRKKDLKGFSDGKKDYKVTDCCECTGKYRGDEVICNLRYKIPRISYVASWWIKL